MTDGIAVNPVESKLSGFAPLGEVFFAARSAKKLALKDISNSLRLSIKQIEALESNDFSKLPQAMITRGFIRNYARLLELDTEPLLASYRERMPESSPGTLSVKTSMNQVMLSKANPGLLKYFLVAGLLLISVVAWFYYTNFMQKKKQKTEANVASASAPVAETPPLPEVALPAAERAAEVETDQVVNTGAVEVPNQLDESMPPQAASGTDKQDDAGTAPQSSLSNSVSPSLTQQTTQTEQTAKESAVDFNTLKEKAAQKALLSNPANPNVAGVAKAPELSQSGLKADSSIAAIKGVSLAVTESSWVRVTDKTGAVVFEKMLPANSADGFNGLPPFKMIIGNAHATKLTFLGKEVDLTSKTKNNVARVTLE